MDNYYLNWFLEGKYRLDSLDEMKLDQEHEIDKLLIRYLSENRQSTSQILGTLNTVVTQINLYQWSCDELENWTELLMESIYKIFQSSSYIKHISSNHKRSKAVPNQGELKGLKDFTNNMVTSKVKYDQNIAISKIETKNLHMFAKYSEDDFIKFISNEIFPLSLSLAKEARRLINKFGIEKHWFQTSQLDELDHLYDKTAFIYMFIEVLSAWFSYHSSVSS